MISAETRESGHQEEEIKMKKGLFALVALAMILAAAPEAAADHCWKCSNFTNCVPSTGYGKSECHDYSGRCEFYGYSCSGPHPFVPEEPLAAEFVVASVERLDEPQQQPDTEVRLASLETKQQTADR
jgi:hypothetical protein